METATPVWEWLEERADCWRRFDSCASTAIEEGFSAGMPYAVLPGGMVAFFNSMRVQRPAGGGDKPIRSRRPAGVPSSWEFNPTGGLLEWKQYDCADTTIVDAAWANGDATATLSSGVMVDFEKMTADGVQARLAFYPKQKGAAGVVLWQWEADDWVPYKPKDALAIEGAHCSGQPCAASIQDGKYIVIPSMGLQFNTSNQAARMVRRMQEEGDLPVVEEVAKEQDMRAWWSSRAPPDPEAECSLCLDEVGESAVRLKQCADGSECYFHEECLSEALSIDHRCPRCRVQVGMKIGNQPSDSEMHVYVTSRERCEHFESFSTLVVQLSVPEGDENDRKYAAFSSCAYFPNSEDGQRALQLLRKAWSRRLVLQVTCTAEEATVGAAFPFCETLHGDDSPDGPYMERLLSLLEESVK